MHKTYKGQVEHQVPQLQNIYGAGGYVGQVSQLVNQDVKVKGDTKPKVQPQTSKFVTQIQPAWVAQTK